MAETRIRPLTPIVALTLGIGTQILCTTHLLNKFFLPVKFHQICYSSFRVMAETRFVTDGQTDRQMDDKWTDGRTVRF